jgi:hypothetical protein
MKMGLINDSRIRESKTTVRDGVQISKINDIFISFSYTENYFLDDFHIISTNELRSSFDTCTIIY